MRRSTTSKRDRTDRLSLACRAALEVSAGVAYASFLLVEARQPRGESAARELLFWLCVTALVLLPLFPSALESLLPRRVFGRAAPHLGWMLQLLPLVLLGPTRPVHLAMGGLALLQGNLLVRSADDRVAVWSLALGPITALTGWALTPSPEWLALFPLSLLAAGAALSLVRARMVERDLRARAPRVLLRVQGSAPPAAGGEWRRRALAALPPVLVVIAGLPIAHGLVALARAPLTSLWERDPIQERARERERLLEQQRAVSGGQGGREARSLGRFPDELEFGGDVTQLEGHAVMAVTPRIAGEVVRTAPLYMRGLVLDTFGEAGVVFGEPLDHRTVHARRDGWIGLGSPSERPLELDVLLEPLFLAGDWSPVLFAPRPVAAVHCEPGRVEHHPDDRLLLPVAPQQTIHYLVETELPRDPLQDPPRGPARHPDPRYTQLPPPSEARARIAERARDAVGEAGDDAARVRRLMEHFRRGYAYSLEPREISGLDGVAEFLRRREGSCTWFAAAAVLMLRCSGLPARLATGYLASEWSEEDEHFLVTTRNGHAWIEVHFEDEGWVTYDPTPPDRRAAAWAMADVDPDSGLSGWFAELRENLAFWATTGGHDAYLRALLRTLADAPRALLATLRNQPGWVALSLALVVVLWARRRSKRRAVAVAATGGIAPLQDELQRLLTALAAKGHARRPSQTLRELARDLARGGEPYAPLPLLADALQRGRYGARPLTDAEERELDEFLRALRG